MEILGKGHTACSQEYKLPQLKFESCEKDFLSYHFRPIPQHQNYSNFGQMLLSLNLEQKTLYLTVNFLNSISD